MTSSSVRKITRRRFDEIVRARSPTSKEMSDEAWRRKM